MAQIAKKERSVIWSLLTALFLVQGLYYVYLISLPSEGTTELLLDKLYGFATFGFPLAALCASILLLKIRTRLSNGSTYGIALLMGSLGVVFLLVGIYAVYEAWPEPEMNMSLKALVSTFIGFVVYPVGVLFVAWRYFDRSDIVNSNFVQAVPFFICLAAHIMQFALEVLWPFAEVFRFGGAALALLFSAVNFYNLRTSGE